MLFNSYIFIFAFLPIVLSGFFYIGKYDRTLAALWLTVASLFFYAWWDIRFLALLLSSIAFNYTAGYVIRCRTTHHRLALSPKVSLIIAIATNLFLLGYFKYANFFAENFSHLTGSVFSASEILLPLGISFFTFTQIAFLVDSYQGKVREPNFIHYTLFVTYFPHLIAGPILHHKEIMPQFAKQDVYQINWRNMTVGLTIFILGLAKKVLLADALSPVATPIFEAVKIGNLPMVFEAWIGAVAYTLQIYFDFSAYSDMAIGLSLMFNIRLPLNFNSPYRSSSMIDTWQRWHITLTRFFGHYLYAPLARFLRDYIYVPLGGSRYGKMPRFVSMICTLLVCGLWHGSSWTFVFWGGLQGFYLLTNYSWRAFKVRMNWEKGGRLAQLSSVLLTFMAATVSLVFFRADSLTTAIAMLQGMFGFNGVSLPSAWSDLGLSFTQYDWLLFKGINTMVDFDTFQALGKLIIGLAIVWFSPNVWQLFQTYRPTLGDLISPSQPYQFNHFVQWRLSKWQAWATGTLFAVSIIHLTQSSEFLYFQF